MVRGWFAVEELCKIDNPIRGPRKEDVDEFTLEPRNPLGWSYASRPGGGRRPKIVVEKKPGTRNCTVVPYIHMYIPRTYYRTCTVHTSHGLWCADQCQGAAGGSGARRTRGRHTRTEEGDTKRFSCEHAEGIRGVEKDG